MSKCIKCSQEIVATSPTVDTNLGDAHLSCPPNPKVGIQIPFLGTSEPSLVLTVVDFGDSCVVKVERGIPDVERFFTSIIVSSWKANTALIDVPFSGFEGVRKSIDAHFAESDRPVPRIEKNEKGFGLFTHNACNWFLQKEHYNALNELARAAGATRDLEIYEPKGTWTQLTPPEHITPFVGMNGKTEVVEALEKFIATIPVSIYRYER